jgi:hypothetical protein
VADTLPIVKSGDLVGDRFDNSPARGAWLRERVTRNIRGSAEQEPAAWFLGEVIGTPFRDEAGEPLRAAR